MTPPLSQHAAIVLDNTTHRRTHAGTDHARPFEHGTGGGVSPYYADDHVTLWHGDAAVTLAQLEAGSVDCIVTSPPYFGLRDYGVDGQIGAEPTPAEFVEALVAVFREARRVLSDDGTLWLNLGDTYYSGRGASQGADEKNPARRFGVRAVDKGGADWAKPKDLLGIPWRVAFALQEDGWILRNDIIWAKPNAMPESVTDRLSNRHEHLFMFSKRARYWFDLDPIREPLLYPEAADGSKVFDGVNKHENTAPGARARRTGNRYGAQRPGDNREQGADRDAAHPKGRNPGDVWTIATSPFPGAHFATFPPELARRCVLAGCRPGGTVLDPFSGSGTTGLVATENGRRYVGIDLNDEYLELSLRTRLKQGVLDFGGVA